MNFSSLEMVPGIVYNAEDPEKLGRVKACAPGLFDTNSMHDEAIPWIYPFMMTGYQNFSKMFKGSKVWVIQNKDNINEYYYMPFMEQIDVSNDYLKDNYNNSPDIIVSRNNGVDRALSTYDKNNGFKQSVSNSSINIKPTDEVKINAGGGNVAIQQDKVKLGKTDVEYEPAVKGKKLVELLTEIRKGFEDMRDATKYSFVIQSSNIVLFNNGLNAIIDALEKNLDTILSENVSIN